MGIPIWCARKTTIPYSSFFEIIVDAVDRMTTIYFSLYTNYQINIRKISAGTVSAHLRKPYGFAGRLIVTPV